MARRNGGFIGTDGLDAPDPPTGVTGSGGNTELSVAFTAPTDTGTSAITGFVAQVSTDGTDYSGGSNTGTSSPIVVSSLTNGTNYTAKVWAINAYGTSAPSDASTAASPGVRALFMGGEAQSGNVATIDFISIGTTGNTSDFGDLSAVKSGSALGSSTRAIQAGSTGPTTDVIEFVTISTAGDGTDFGNLSAAMQPRAGASSNVRGLFFSAGTVTSDEVQYITIASAGNTTDFGNLSAEVSVVSDAYASPTRALIGGGVLANNNRRNNIDYFTIASAGNATDFGNLSVISDNGGAAGSNLRCVFSIGLDDS